MFFIAALVACGGNDEGGQPADDRFVPQEGSRPQRVGGDVASVATEYVDELNVDLSAMTVTETGLRYRDIVVGDGAEAAQGHSVVTRYTGWLPSGVQFDSGVYPPPGGGQLILGTGAVIPGWDQGLVGMRVGGKRQLVVPPELGYGSAGAGGVIPPGATLVFEVELLSTGN